MSDPKALESSTAQFMIGTILALLLWLIVPNWLSRPAVLIAVLILSFVLFWKSGVTFQIKYVWKLLALGVSAIIFLVFFIPYSLHSYRSAHEERTEFSDYTDVSLIRFETDFSKKLRAQQSAFDQVTNKVYAKGEERTITFNQYTSEIIQNTALENQVFANEYQGTARALEIELQERSGGIVDLTQKPPKSLDEANDAIAQDHIVSGLMSGPAPLTDIANYLDKLTRELPEK